ncbi:hypothetical protein HH800_05745 [Sphingobium yanoikuyae]|uniref:Uncharacterized protein n=1 Tax=Sphingobium yanoikuyae TaxID=13690 RepID=A0A6M4G3R8_SPHYA|nr:hypothetical protein [Sphingobium yanoikuyae]QJR01739.1 hypothetical protein HH800_05745 [Sphingobium yanoikuyae]
MHWGRISAALATAIVGIGGAWIILAADEAPKALIAISGLLGIAGLAGAALLVAAVSYLVSEVIRPAFRFRKPAVPMALSHREAALIGHKSFRNHPVKFWGGLILGNSFFFGFMIFGAPEYERFKVEEQRP